MRGRASRSVLGLLAALTVAAAGAPNGARAGAACAVGCPERQIAAQTRLERAPVIAADPAACARMEKAKRLALALFAMCHSFASPADRLCADYSAACARLRAAGCPAAWACD